MPRRSSFSRFSITAAAGPIVAMALVGCSASVSTTTPKATLASTAASTAGPSSSVQPTTTLREETSTTAAAGGSLTVADLEAALPEASDIGPDYTVKADSADSGNSDAGDEAIKKSCPEAAELIDLDRDVDRARRKFETNDNRGVEVELEPGASTTEQWSKTNLESLMNAVNGCDPISYVDSGMNVEMKLNGTFDSNFGEHSGTLTIDATLSGVSPTGSGSLELKMVGRIFIVGDVAVMINVSSGADEQMQAVPGDFELLDPLSKQMEKAVTDLQAAQH